MNIRLRHQPLRRAQLALQSSSLKKLLRPAYYTWNRWRFGALVSRNAALKGILNGQRCFILLTGPSVREVDFDCLRGEHVIATAHLYRHPSFSRLRVSAYVDTEPLQNLYGQNVVFEVRRDRPRMMVTPSNAQAMIADVYATANSDCPAHVRDNAPFYFYKNIETSCADPDTVFLLNAASRRHFAKRGLFRGRRTHWLTTMALPIDEASELSDDLAGAVTFMNGTVFLAMAAAIYMGAGEIYLAGAGYTYSPRQEGHFYDRPMICKSFGPERARSIARQMAAARGVELDSVRLEGDYYVAEYQRALPVDSAHERMQAFATSRGVRIYNIVPPGVTSPVYEGVSWTSVRTLLTSA